MIVSDSPSTPAERVFESLGRLAILPVVEIDDPALAIPLGETLLSAGLPCAEITFRTAGAAAAITALRRHCPELLVGAGTILSTQQVDIAREAGAAFLVSPGLDAVVVQHARRFGLPFVPGVCTPSEIQAASAQGLDVLKFFPAEVAGGVRFLKAVSPVFPNIRYVPTGGIGPANVATYLELPTVLSCGGSWMVPRALIVSRDFGSIERLIREAVELTRGTRGQAIAGQEQEQEPANVV